MHDNEMDGFPPEKINMAKNLKDMIVCEYVPNYIETRSDEANSLASSYF
jgi:hypothetical protein